MVGGLTVGKDRHYFYTMAVLKEKILQEAKYKKGEYILLYYGLKARIINVTVMRGGLTYCVITKNGTRCIKESEIKYKTKP